MAKGNPNPNEATRFAKDNKLASKNKGKQQKRTIVRSEWRLDDPKVIARFEGNIIKVIDAVMEYGNEKDKLHCALELLPYFKAKKKEVTLEVGQSFEDFILELNANKEYGIHERSSEEDNI